MSWTGIWLGSYLGQWYGYSSVTVTVGEILDPATIFQLPKRLTTTVQKNRGTVFVVLPFQEEITIDRSAIFQNIYRNTRKAHSIPAVTVSPSSNSVSLHPSSYETSNLTLNRDSDIIVPELTALTALVQRQITLQEIL